MELKIETRKTSGREKIGSVFLGSGYKRERKRHCQPLKTHFPLSSLW